MYVYYYRTYEKAVSGGGEREKGGHVLRDTTSRGLYVRVWEYLWLPGDKRPALRVLEELSKSRRRR